MSNHTTPTTVLGLGAMGSALAAALIDAGHPTTVWNRSPNKAGPLVARGATAAGSPEAAVSASPLIVACLFDQLRFTRCSARPQVACAGAAS